MPALANEIRERLSLRALSPRDIDMLMAVDSGNDVGLDGQLNSGAVAYFEALAEGRGSKMVVNWCVNTRKRGLGALLMGFNQMIKDIT